MRCWSFKCEIPTIDKFANGDFNVVAQNLSCLSDTINVNQNTYFVQAKENIRDKLMMDEINFQKFPIACLPQEALEWWLLARGNESINNADSTLEETRMATFHLHARKAPLLSPSVYKTNYSNFLHSMLAKSTYIPVMTWCEGNSSWKLVTAKDTKQNFDDFKKQLSTCLIDESILEPERETKSFRNGQKMRNEGGVLWQIMLAVRWGTSNVIECDNDKSTVPRIMFTLLCTPSQRSGLYHVEIVFDYSEEARAYEVNKLLCFCTCQRGITEYWCSHRIAVFLWLKSIQDTFATISEATSHTLINFHQYAKAINLPPPLLGVASLPMVVEQLLIQSNIQAKLLAAQNFDPQDLDQINDLKNEVGQSSARIKAALDLYLSDIRVTNLRLRQSFFLLDYYIGG